MSRKHERRKRIKRAVDRMNRPALPELAIETARTVLQAEAQRPLRGGETELPFTSLFGESHLQRELFDKA